MKFSYQLEYNAFTKWHGHYIAYKRLKKMIKSQRRDAVNEGIQLDSEAFWDEFVVELQDDITRVCSAFQNIFDELRDCCEQLCKALHYAEKAEAHSLSEATAPLKTRNRCVELFLELHELKNFIHLNTEGVRKIVKKFDKLNGTSHVSEFTKRYAPLSQMVQSRPAVEGFITELQSAFARVYTEGDRDAAREELSKSLHALLVWDKGTIWNDLLKLEQNKTRLGTKKSAKPTTFTDSLPIYLVNLGLVGLFIILLVFPLGSHQGGVFVPFLSVHAQRCLAVLSLISGWWALGTFPLHITALSVPILVVACRALPSPSHPAAEEMREDLDPKSSAAMMIQAMWGGSQILVLGSFSLAAALSKLRLDKEFAYSLLAAVKQGKEKTIWALMILGWTSSALVGNVAASVLCLSMAQPILDELPEGSRSTPVFARRLLIGIAFACNLGGMTSPIASPQNVVAFAALNKHFGDESALGFVNWICVAIPTSLVLLISTFFVLAPSSSLKSLASSSHHALPLDATDLGSSEALLSSQAQGDALPPRLVEHKKTPWTFQQVSVLIVCAATISMWLGGKDMVQPFLGDLGLASVLPLLFLFGLPGILTKADFLSLPWDVCFLLAGGQALGVAVKESQLLHQMGEMASSKIDGVPPQVCLFLSCCFVTLASTFVSHTAAANVLLPFICEIGAQVFGARQAVRLGLTSSFCLSAGCALPVSGVPNMNATSVSRVSDSSQAWLSPSDFLRPGLLVSVLAVLVISFLGDMLTQIFCVL